MVLLTYIITFVERLISFVRNCSHHAGRSLSVRCPFCVNLLIHMRRSTRKSTMTLYSFHSYWVKNSVTWANNG